MRDLSVKVRTGEYARAFLVASIGLLFLDLASANAFTWPWDAKRGWPSSSSSEVVPLDRPSVDEWSRIDGAAPAGGFRFAVMGDQRALADGEWQELLRRIKENEVAGGRLLCLIDTGDIVQDGRRTDQFERLTRLLALGPAVPYLVGVGNHEVRENTSAPARANTARFLAGVDSSLSASKLYYRKDAGSVRFYFLDTNDLVYGDTGNQLEMTEPAPGSRAEAQMRWLVDELAAPPADREVRIAIMHHPFVSSSKKHREQARGLWSYRYQGRTLPDILIDGRVSLVLTGHTHTYERFRLRRSDGREFQLINFSGRPRESMLWFGGEAREAQDWRGREEQSLRENGWTGLERWEVRQEEATLGAGSDQFGIVSVGADGRLGLMVHFLEPNKVGEAVQPGPVRIR